MAQPLLSLSPTDGPGGFGASVGTAKRRPRQSVLARNGSGENVQVYVRVRPLIGRESGSSRAVVVEGANMIHIEGKDHSHVECKYHHVFGPSQSQSDVYDHVRDCTNNVVDGFNSTLFAYGQTGSGKTFTLFGREEDDSVFSSAPEAAPTAGIIPRAIRDLFSKVDTRRASATSSADDVTVYCSFVQVYNEMVFDLLRDPNTAQPLALRETVEEGVFVEGLSEFVVDSVSDCLAIVERGQANRAIRSTFMNQHSSRSHAILQLQVETVSPSDGITRSRLNLVDLAGSEKWNTEAEMDRLHIAEMTNINLSLHTLSRCINALAKKNGSSASHVPFRESKLTRMLKSSLAGQAKVRLIATLSPSELNLSESLNTLKFADSAKRVMTRARLNVSMVPDRVLVKRLQAEVDRLKRLIMSQSNGEIGVDGSGGGDGAGGGGGGDGGNMTAQVMELEAEVTRLTEVNQKLLSAVQKMQTQMYMAQNQQLANSPEPSRLHKRLSAAAAARRSGSGSGSGAGSGGGGAAVHVPPPVSLDQFLAMDSAGKEEAEFLSEENTLLSSTVQKMRDITEAFFSLDIEEDEMQFKLKTAWSEFQTKSTDLQARKPAPRQKGKARAGSQLSVRSVETTSREPAPPPSGIATKAIAEVVEDEERSTSTATPPANHALVSESKTKEDKERAVPVTKTKNSNNLDRVVSPLVVGSAQAAGLGHTTPPSSPPLSKSKSAADLAREAMAAANQVVREVVSPLRTPRKLAKQPFEEEEEGDGEGSGDGSTKDGQPSAADDDDGDGGDGDGDSEGEQADAPVAAMSPSGSPRRPMSSGSAIQLPKLPKSPYVNRVTDDDGMISGKGSSAQALRDAQQSAMWTAPSDSSDVSDGEDEEGQQQNSRLPPSGEPTFDAKAAAAGNKDSSEAFKAESRRTSFLAKLREGSGGGGGGGSGGGGGPSSSLSASMGATGGLKFRVRDRKGNASGLKDANTGAGVSTPTKARKELKKAYAEMEKNRKLQVWLEEKARRHAEAAEEAMKVQQAAMKAQKKKEAARRKRQEKIKRDLERKKAEDRALTEQLLKQQEERNRLESAKRRRNRELMHKSVKQTPPASGTRPKSSTSGRRKVRSGRRRSGGGKQNRKSRRAPPPDSEDLFSDEGSETPSSLLSSSSDEDYRREQEEKRRQRRRRRRDRERRERHERERDRSDDDDDGGGGGGVGDETYASIDGGEAYRTAHPRITWSDDEKELKGGGGGGGGDVDTSVNTSPIHSGGGGGSSARPSLVSYDVSTLSGGSLSSGPQVDVSMDSFASGSTFTPGSGMAAYSAATTGSPMPPYGMAYGGGVPFNPYAFRANYAAAAAAASAGGGGAAGAPSPSASMGMSIPTPSSSAAAAGGVAGTAAASGGMNRFNTYGSGGYVPPSVYGLQSAASRASGGVAAGGRPSYGMMGGAGVGMGVGMGVGGPGAAGGPGGYGGMFSQMYGSGSGGSASASASGAAGSSSLPPSNYPSGVGGGVGRGVGGVGGVGGVAPRPGPGAGAGPGGGSVASITYG